MTDELAGMRNALVPRNGKNWAKRSYPLLHAR